MDKTSINILHVMHVLLQDISDSLVGTGSEFWTENKQLHQCSGFKTGAGVSDVKHDDFKWTYYRVNIFVW